MDVRDYAALQHDLALAGLVSSSSDSGDKDSDNDAEPFLFLFSRSGFTDRLSDLAARQDTGRLRLVSLPDLYTP